MNANNITKHYTNGEITIVWEPANCTHAGICVKTLPQVYHPNQVPWVDIANATTQELKDQVAMCPSGALTCYMNADGPPPSTSATTATATTPTASQEISAVVIPDGPLMVNGDIAVTKADGTIDHRTKATAFCRCGASENKPYCDGAHKKIGFKG